MYEDLGIDGSTFHCILTTQVYSDYTYKRSQEQSVRFVTLRAQLRSANNEALQATSNSRLGVSTALP